MEQQQRKSLDLGKPLLSLLFSSLMLVFLFGSLPRDMKAEFSVPSLKRAVQDNYLHSLDYMTGVSTCEQTENLVPNPGFEEGRQGPDGWEPDDWLEEGDCDFHYDDPGYEGSDHSARIHAGHTRDEKCKVRTASGAVSVEAGRFYDYSAWVKAIALQGEVYLKIRFEPTGEAYTAPVADTQGAWVRVTGSVQTPSDAEHARIEATVPESSLGLVWFDNLHLELATCLDISKRDDPDPVSPGQMLTYTVVYSNTGRERATNVWVVETYDDDVSFQWADPEPLTETTNLWLIPEPELPELFPGVSGAITVVVQVRDYVTGSAWLFNNFQIFSDETMEPIYRTITTSVDGNGCKMVLFSPKAEGVGKPGELTDYTLVLENKGACDGQVGLVAFSSQGWDVLISPSPPYNLLSGGSKEVTVSPVVPQCELSGTVDVTAITATLECDAPCGTMETETAAVTTTVERVSGVEIEPNLIKPPPTSGTTVAFVHTVTNTGNWTDAIAFTHGFPEGITVDIEPSQIEDLGLCRSGTTTATVGGLTSSSEFSGIITATCMSDPSEFDVAIDAVKLWKVRLPPVMSGYCYCAPSATFNSCFVSPCDFAPWWEEEGSLGRKVVRLGEDDYNPFGCCAARLGNPSYDNQEVPVGRATTYQTVEVPNTASPELELVYAMYSYDIMRGKVSGKLYDSFEIAVNDLQNVLFRTGNPEGKVPASCRSEVWTSGIRTESLDLASYAGQMVTLYFSVWNRVDGICNTWVYIDSVRIAP